MTARTNTERRTIFAFFLGLFADLNVGLLGNFINTQFGNRRHFFARLKGQKQNVNRENNAENLHRNF